MYIAQVLISAIAEYYYNADEKSKAAKKVTLVNETLPFYMKKLDAIARDNNGYLTNKRVTIISIIVF